MNFGWIKKLVKMIIFPGKVGIDGYVLVHEVKRSMKRLNATCCSAVAFVIEGVIAGVVIVGHGD